MTSTMNISLSQDMKAYVESQVASGDYATASEYVRDLIRKERELNAFRRKLVDGIESGPGVTVDKAFFEEERSKLRDRAAA